jgi:tight adherence protein C
LSSIFLLFLGVILGFFVPDIILYNNVAKRREKFAEALPDAIDLLTMCVNAGLAFPQSLAKVSDIQKGPVSEEFIRVRTEVQLGKERNVALGEMADRIKLDSLTNFVNAVAQVDRFGIPISAVLQQQSVELRAERKAKGREKAQKVPIKILGPVMLCFLPCVIIIVLGPAIIGILGSF